MRKRLISAIIEEDGGRFEGKTRLFKVYYRAHTVFAERFEGLLSVPHGVVRMDEGPGIDDHEQILAEMESEGTLRITRCPKGRHLQEVFELCDSAAAVNASADERKAINWALGYVSHSAREASRKSHKDSRSWRSASNGQSLDIYLDTLTDKELREEQRRLDEAEAFINDALAPPGPRPPRQAGR